MQETFTEALAIAKEKRDALRAVIADGRYRVHSFYNGPTRSYKADLAEVEKLITVLEKLQDDERYPDESRFCAECSAEAQLFSDEADTCETCAAEGFTLDESGAITDPGKFEAEPLATYHAYHSMLDGFTDEDSGRAWLVGNMICEESESGFVGADIYESEEAAREAWDRLVEIDYAEQYS